MIRKCLSLLTAAVSGMVLCACASGPSCTELAETDSGKTLTMEPGDRFSVTLKSNPTTGFQWSFAAPYDERVLVLCGDTYINPSESLAVGAPGQQKLTFEAAGPGKTGVRLAYRRPWEKGAAPAKVFHLLVFVKGDAASGNEDDSRTPRIGSKGEVVPERKGLLE